jgi:hypothetical protein
MGMLQKIKRSKVVFYLTHFTLYKSPGFLFRPRLKFWLTNNHPDVQKRLQYYASPSATKVSPNWQKLSNFRRPKRGSMYFFDLVKYTKYFPKHYQINYKFGDVTENFEEPTLVKSRPINHNGNSVLMKLDSRRHFHFVKDHTPFLDKDDKMVWRGVIHKENRRLLVEKFHAHPHCDIGDVSTHHDWVPDAWKKPYLSIEEQLQSKFILSIEGIDVATNLKWIMASNSLCFMPTPKFETWYMEGLLVPDVHYVHIKDDYSDLMEKRSYYLNNPEKALKIIENAQEWVRQFLDPKTENTLSIQVLNRFFEKTQQKSS